MRAGKDSWYTYWDHYVPIDSQLAWLIVEDQNVPQIFISLRSRTLTVKALIGETVQGVFCFG
jgi:hypothetical protein